MRALRLERYGDATGVNWGDLPAPAPGPGEVLVRVRAAGLNPVDFKTREGGLKLLLPFTLPVAMGNELAGVVEALGAGVTGVAVGDAVYARVEKRTMGAIAELAAVPAALVARMPASLDFNTAAGVPLAALTALQCLRDELELKPGQHVFINGGAGGVGTFAIQLAKQLGATVTTTASPRGDALVRRLGADHVIDYTQANFWDELKDLDGAFDLVGPPTLARCFDVVKRGATVVSIAGVPEPETSRRDLGGGAGLTAIFWAISLPLRLRAAARGVTYRYKFMHPSGPELAELAALIDQGKLQVVMERVFPASQAAEAFALLESGHAKGKIVLDMSTPG